MLEYIKHYVPEAKIILCDNETEDRISNAIKLPFADEILESDPDDRIFDYSLNTHHRHWTSTIHGYPRKFGKPLYFDLHGFKLRMIAENWYPTLVASEKSIEAFNKLNLPKIYDCWAMSDDKSAMKRHGLGTFEWLSANFHKYYDGTPTVTTNHNIPTEDRDVGHLPGWLKIMVMFMARKLYCSQSGFTCIASIYRKRKDSFLMNYDPDIALLTGPPPVCYSNCEAVINAHDWKNLYYAADNRTDWNDYYPKWTHRDCSENYFKYNSQYEGLNMKSFEQAPETYQPVSVSFIRENCLVPESTKFRLDKGEYKTLVPSNRVWAWAGSSTGKTI